MGGGHGHDHAPDAALASSDRGIRAVTRSLLALLVTAAAQAAVVAASGSVALLADTIHNLSDALTGVPLWIAFVLGRRPPSRRYPYGLHRAEDLAGVVIVLAIAASAALAGWEALRRLADPRPPEHLPLVAAAGAIGFLGNELVARYRIAVGRRIGSAALVADGHHARTDGFTSLGVVAAAAGQAAGIRLADPVVGLAITVAILLVLRGAASSVIHRILDGTEESTILLFEEVAAAVPGVEHVSDVRARWAGHGLVADLCIQVDPRLSVEEGHAIAERVRHALLHEVGQLRSAVVHVDPHLHDGPDPHAPTAHHEGRADGASGAVGPPG